MTAELVGISLAIEPGTGYYIPVGHKHGSQMELKSALSLLSAPMSSPDIPKAGHNMKYDYVVLQRHGLHVTPLAFDTMIAEWLTNPTSRNLGLKNLAWVRQGIQMTDIEQLIGKGAKQRSMAEVPVENAAPYAAADAEVVLRLIPELQEELDERNAGRLFKDLELPLIEVLAEMEMAGVALDTHFLSGMSSELTESMAEYEGKIFSEVGKSFNLNSPQQLSAALFEKLEILPPDRTQRTASGFYSTSASVLETLPRRSSCGRLGAGLPGTRQIEIDLR